jgi:hypothetical protein
MTTHSIPASATERVPATLVRTVTAGALAGVVFNAVGFVTFVLLGSGLDNRSGPLFDPDLQSDKMIAVWTSIEPLPLFKTQPGTIFALYVLFGIGYAVLYRSVGWAWPSGFWRRAPRLALTIWWLSCVFFELLGPFNLLGEPLSLVALELAFWAAMAAAAAAVVVAVLTPPQPHPDDQQAGTESGP